MNIGEIARRAGVSRSTVSSAVSGKRTVSPASQGRIRPVIDELDRLDTTSGIVQNNQVRVLAQRITLLPPSDGGFQSVAVAQHSQQCLDSTYLSTADGNQQQQFFCDGGDQQLWNLRPAAGVADTYTMVNQQTGKCFDVSGISTAARALVHQWTCNPASQASPLNQTWRLWGRINPATPNSATAAALPGRYR